MKQLLLLIIATILLTKPLFAMDNPPRSYDEARDELKRDFIPTKETVVLKYEVVYKLMFIKLLKLASAVIKTTEGDWIRESDGTRIPVYLIEVSLNTLEDPDEKRKRISLHDRFAAILSRDPVETICYMRNADQYFRPFFSNPTINHHFEVYDFQGDQLDFFYVNEETGEIVTNVTENAKIAQQGREISELLRVMSSVYYGETELLNYTNSPKVFIDINRKATPFVLRTIRDNINARPLNKPIEALQVSAIPEEAIEDQRLFELWTASLMSVAECTDNERFQEIAAESPSWSMTPLLMDYDLKVGYIRCRFSDIELIDSRLPKSDTIAQEIDLDKAVGM